MSIAYTMAPGRGDTDLILAQVAQALQARGVRTCGTVQINTENPGAGRCDMDIQVLPDGPVLCISQSLGRNASGCRLDSAVLEEAVGLVKAALDKGADILIINKFGKQEAEGGGFRDVIAQAVLDGIPVLVGLNDLNAPAFREFAGGYAAPVVPDTASLFAWAEAALKGTSAAA